MGVKLQKDEIEDEKYSKIHLIFLPLVVQRDTALDGPLNASMVPTKYADLYYTTVADMLSLGFIQIGREGTQSCHSGNSSHLNGRDRLAHNGTD